MENINLLAIHFSLGDSLLRSSAGLFAPMLIAVAGLVFARAEMVGLWKWVFLNAAVVTPFAIFQVLQPGNEGIHVATYVPVVLSYLTVFKADFRVGYLGAWSLVFWLAFIPDAVGSYFRALVVRTDLTWADPIMSLGGEGFQDALLVFPIISIFALAIAQQLRKCNPKMIASD